MLTLGSASALFPPIAAAAGEGFGIEPGGFSIALSTTQAGAHPDMTTTLALNQRVPGLPAGRLRDFHLDLPPGFVGNPTAVPRCAMNEVVNLTCPADTRVGVVVVEANLSGEPGGATPLEAFIKNVVPYPNEPAAFAFSIEGLGSGRIDTSVRPDGDYEVHAAVTNISEGAPIVSAIVTLWGVPADHSGSESARIPFLTNPTDCSKPLETRVAVDSWENPGRLTEHGTPDLTDSNWSTAKSILPAPTGCEKLTFEPTISVLPDTFQAGVPAGYETNLAVPRVEVPDAPVAPALKDAVVVLPEGTVLSPSAADGLQGCQHTPAARPTPGSNEFGPRWLEPAACVPGSQVGSVEVITPLLSTPLKGHVFLGQPNCSPCTATDAASGDMLRILLEAQGSGVEVKLEGSVSVNQQTGQLTATFRNNPQLPFSDLKLRLDDGARAPLANPSACGPAVASARLSPWSAPFTPDATPSSYFDVVGGQLHGFAPSFLAGTANNQAGAFSSFSATLSRQASEQRLGALRVTTPPGLLGALKSVARCPEPQASEGTCGLESQIGHTTVGAGPGSPFYIGGNVYLTGPYKGAPFGLSVVVHALAGPFDLGNVIVRAAINVDPLTAQIVATSDELPRVLDGIPLDLRVVNVTIDRPAFMFNPTNCSSMPVLGSVSSTEGAVAGLSAPFEAANCANLPFRPRFTVLTSGKTSKARGASLRVNVASSPGQANIAKVKVFLPRQLPSRLTTLQKACVDRVFDANPAGCPEASLVGMAKAVTPVLAQPLSGPAYLVSHGGEAFPDLEVVLQGEGITLLLIGNTNIKRGLTSSTFSTVPDAPISTFALALPEGPHSVLAANLPQIANGSLCGRSLTMPTTITGQNGAVIKQNTKIAPTGCPRKVSTKLHRWAAHRAKKPKR